MGLPPSFWLAVSAEIVDALVRLSVDSVSDHMLASSDLGETSGVSHAFWLLKAAAFAALIKSVVEVDAFSVFSMAADSCSVAGSGTWSRLSEEASGDM